MVASLVGCALAPAAAQAATTYPQSNGSDGACTFIQSGTLDTNTNMFNASGGGSFPIGSDGVFNCTTLTINSGVTITTVGTGVLDFRATGDVNIAGTIDVDGAPGNANKGGNTAQSGSGAVSNSGGGGGGGSPGVDGAGTGPGKGECSEEAAVVCRPAAGAAAATAEVEAARAQDSREATAAARVASAGPALAVAVPERPVQVLGPAARAAVVEVVAAAASAIRQAPCTPDQPVEAVGQGPRREFNPQPAEEVAALAARSASSLRGRSRSRPPAASSLTAVEVGRRAPA